MDVFTLGDRFLVSKCLTALISRAAIGKQNERAMINLIEGLIAVLVEIRDAGDGTLDTEVIKSHLALEKLTELWRRSSGTSRELLAKYLYGLPGFSIEHLQAGRPQEEGVRADHGGLIDNLDKVVLDGLDGFSLFEAVDDSTAIIVMRGTGDGDDKIRKAAENSVNVQAMADPLAAPVSGAVERETETCRRDEALITKASLPNKRRRFFWFREPTIEKKTGRDPANDGAARCGMPWRWALTTVIACAALGMEVAWGIGNEPSKLIAERVVLHLEETENHAARSNPVHRNVEQSSKKMNQVKPKQPDPNLSALIEMIERNSVKSAPAKSSRSIEEN